MHPLSSPYSVIVPRYYPLRTVMQEGEDPASQNWRPENLVGLWLGDYGPHGTECLFLEHNVADSMIRAWKITGDVNVPRGAKRRIGRIRLGSACEHTWAKVALRDTVLFIESSLISARVIINGKEEIMVAWDLLFTAKVERYKTARGRTGDR
ncbi:hypothetical protein BD309DRAFT_988482 [Dichomitus squalens]|nr:hypothetical protein BD309DRAFT_988482 [Dichomitus squalens]